MKVLVVQCCHLPQFFYAVEQLQARHPDWGLEALLLNEAETGPLLARFDLFAKAHFLDQRRADFAHIDQCLFPLLNRGYGKIKRFAGHLACARFELDYNGNVSPLNRRRLWTSRLRALHRPTVGFVQYVRRFPLAPLGERVLVLESAHSSLIEKAEEPIQALLPPGAEIVRVADASFKRLLAVQRERPCDSVVTFFSGESGYARLKLFAFCYAAASPGVRMSRILVFDENLTSFYVSRRNLTRFLLDRLLQGVASPHAAPRILFVQTETPRYVWHALERLQDNQLFPRSEIVLLCREEDQEQLASAPHVSQTLTYSRRRFRENLKVLAALRRLNLDMTCAIFSGRPWFRRAKLLFLLLPIRRHLVFNAELDCYELSPRTFFWLFRREPLLFDSPEVVPQRVLLLQTEHFQETRSAYQLLRGPKVAPGARISVFCTEEDRMVFEKLPGLERLFTWNRNDMCRSLATAWQLVRFRPDVLAALFSGRPVFRKQKLLFFLLPARQRVVFNRHLDCFYLNWRTLNDFLAREGATPLQGAFRWFVKIPLFFVRFAYLAVWATLMKLKRAARAG